MNLKDWIKQKFINIFNRNKMLGEAKEELPKESTKSLREQLNEINNFSDAVNKLLTARKELEGFNPTVLRQIRNEILLLHRDYYDFFHGDFEELAKRFNEDFEKDWTVNSEGELVQKNHHRSKDPDMEIMYRHVFSKNKGRIERSGINRELNGTLIRFFDSISDEYDEYLHSSVMAREHTRIEQKVESGDLETTEPWPLDDEFLASIDPEEMDHYTKERVEREYSLDQAGGIFGGRIGGKFTPTIIIKRKIVDLKNPDNSSFERKESTNPLKDPDLSFYKASDLSFYTETGIRNWQMMAKKPDLSFGESKKITF